MFHIFSGVSDGPKQVLLKAVFFLACFCGVDSGYATTPAELQKEIETTQEVALKSMQTGPLDIPLAGQATLKLPAGYGFIAKETAAPFLKAAGNQLGEGFLGMVLRDKLEGFVLVEYAKSGYIKDDDAKNWNADELLGGLKEGTTAANKERVERGLPALEVTGWLQAPQYESATHRLVWSAGVKELNANAQQDIGVNYNTYVLGREGFLSLNLVTSQNVFESSKPAAHELLESVHFDSGKAYEDFNANTDTVAEFGLAALIGGLAAKKLGLLAVIGAFLLKTWKLLAIAAFGGFAALKRFFSKQKPKQEA